MLLTRKNFFLLFAILLLFAVVTGGCIGDKDDYYIPYRNNSNNNNNNDNNNGNSPEPVPNMPVDDENNSSYSSFNGTWEIVEGEYVNTTLNMFATYVPGKINPFEIVVFLNDSSVYYGRWVGRYSLLLRSENVTVNEEGGYTFIFLPFEGDFNVCNLVGQP